MELGKAILRRNGMNSLLNALHPDHGLLWTDGKAIYLAPVHLYRDQVENGASTRLGEFEGVESVHWSSGTKADCCFMAAVHHKIVTVWRVSGATPRLAFKQVRKINVQPIPQGCLWNPQNDVLCLLSRQQCSFYFRHAHNRGSFAFPSLEHEKISCGCWSPDGKRLVICVGAALLVYTWVDPETNINDFVTVAWRIPGVSGSITAIVPGSNGCVVCASDLPLETLCKNNNMDRFVMPDRRRKQRGASDIVSPTRGASDMVSLTRGASDMVSLTRGASDMVSPTETVSVKDSLLNLPLNQQGAVEDSAMLTIVQLHPGIEDPSLVTSASVPALLSPDLLHFQTASQCVTVGTNTQNSLQLFALLDNHLLSAGHVALGAEERPKGVCSLHTSQQSSGDGILVLVGTTTATTAESSRALFPSTNHSATYALSLKFFPTRPEKRGQLANGHAASLRPPSLSFLTKSESLREGRSEQLRDSYRHTRQSSYKGERRDHRFRSPDQGASTESRIKLSLAHISSGEAHPRLVEEITDSPHSIPEEGEGESNSPEESLTVERVDFSEVAPLFDNSELAQQYKMSPKTNDDVTLNSAPSESNSELKTDKSLNPASEASFRQRAAKDKSLSPALEAKSRHPATKNKTNSPTSKASSNTSDRILNCAASHSVRTSSPAATARDGQSPVRSTGAEKSEDNGVGLVPKSTPVHSDGDGCRQASRSSHPPHTQCVKRQRHPGDDDGSVCSSGSSSYEVLEKQIQAQNDQIAALQKRLEEIAALVEGGACAFPAKYQEMAEPEAVSIQCVVGGAKVTRRFLLDDGRLQLESVKQAFGLSSVELILEGEAFVLGANMDGYIPMKFKAGKGEALVLGANMDGYIPMKFKAGSFLQVTGIPMVYSSQFTKKPRNKETAKS